MMFFLFGLTAIWHSDILRYLLALFTPRKFDTEQMFVLVRMGLRNRWDAQPVRRYKGCAIYTRY